MKSKKSNESSFVNAIRQVFRVLLAEELHICMPGRIESYNSKTRKATVLPLIKKKYLDNTELEYDSISDVPVMFYGVGASGVRLPESEFKGQTVTLIFSERSLDYWLNSGGKVEPGNNRKFDLTDAIAILSLNSFNNTDSGGDNVEIFFKNSVFRIKPNGNIEIGVNDFLRLINENFKSNYDGHGHEYILPGPVNVISSTPMASVIPPTLGLPTPILTDEMTSKVKVE